MDDDSRMRDFYEVLDITDRRCADEDIKKAYKKMAMKWHPDKNIGNEADATEKFKEVRHAYSVLSDARERQWYDAHRDEILRGGDGTGAGGDPSGYSSGDGENEAQRAGGGGHGRRQPRRRPPQGPNIMRFYSPNVYGAFDDGPRGFFTIFGALFAELDNVERKWWDLDRDTRDRGKDGPYTSAPGFGRSDASTHEVQSFYQFWAGFVSCRSFAECDRYNPADADDRRMRRAMEAENAKSRRTERSKLQGDIRDLAQYLRRRDPRVAEMREKQREKQAAEAQRKAIEKKAKAEAYDKARREWREAEERRLRKMAEDEAANGYSGTVRLADLESDGDDSQGGRRKDKKKGRRGGRGRKGGRVGEASRNAAMLMVENQRGEEEEEEEEDGDDKFADAGSGEVDEEAALRELEEEARRLEAGGAIIESDSGGGGGNSDNNEASSLGGLSSLEEEEEEQEPDVWRCAVCGKDFKSKAQFAQHEKSKVHKKKVAYVLANDRAASRIIKEVEEAAGAAAAIARTASVADDESDDESNSDGSDEETGYGSAIDDEEVAFPAVALREAQQFWAESPSTEQPGRDGRSWGGRCGGGARGNVSDSSSSTSSFDDALLIGGTSTKATKIIAAQADSDSDDSDIEYLMRMGRSNRTAESVGTSTDEGEEEEEEGEEAMGSSKANAADRHCADALSWLSENDNNGGDEDEDDEKERHDGGGGAICPPPPPDAASGERSNRSKNKLSRKQKRAEKAKSMLGLKGDRGAGGAASNTCRVCKSRFMTRSALFRHLEESGHAMSTALSPACEAASSLQEEESTARSGTRRKKNRKGKQKQKS